MRIIRLFVSKRSRGRRRFLGKAGSGDRRRVCLGHDFGAHLLGLFGGRKGSELSLRSGTGLGHRLEGLLGADRHRRQVE